MRLQLLGSGHDHRPRRTPGNTANLATATALPIAVTFSTMPGQRQAGLATGHGQEDVGEALPEVDLDETLRDLGLGERVIRLDYVESFDAFVDWAADLFARHPQLQRS